MATHLNAETLGQLLLMQSILINLPDRKSIFSFVCKGLLDIPGIAKVKYFENGYEQEKLPNEVKLSIHLGSSFFGDIVITVSEISVFNPYKNYLDNFVFMIGVILEERNQRRINQEHKDQLEQKIYERTQELCLEKENLLESERRFTDLMKNVKLLSVMLDVNGNIIFANQYLLSLTNYSSEEIIGKNWFDLFIPEETKEKHKKIFKNLISVGTPVNNYENEISNKSGEKLLISWNNTILRDANRKIIGTASIGENITERKIAEEALVKKNTEYKILNEEYFSLNEELKKNLEILKSTNSQLEIAKAKAEESDRLKTAFLHNLSHEIRTPMNAIMGFSGLLVNNYNNKSKLEKFSGIISRRCNDLLDIINDILDIAKIESGQLDLNYSECNLHELFKELKNFFSAYQVRLEKPEIKFEIHPPEGPLQNSFVTDELKLKQIFINLLTNAFKFTEKGKIECGCRLENDKAIFFVTDTGIGIPADKQDIIFERFAQVHHNLPKNIGGTGLGLSIVKGLISLFEGEIFLESTPGKGTTFTFTLPNKSNTAEKNKPASEEKHQQYSFSNKTVLIVEDDIYNAEYLKEILDDTGFKTIITKYGEEAYRIASSKKIDLILMDIRLPDIDGYEATRLIRKDKSNVKIIAQTAYASDDEKQKALNAGCNDYISKPTKRDSLLTMITNQFR